jgi:hypothetical protein
MVAQKCVVIDMLDDPVFVHIPANCDIHRWAGEVLNRRYSCVCFRIYTWVLLAKTLQFSQMLFTACVIFDFLRLSDRT